MKQTAQAQARQDTEKHRHIEGIIRSLRLVGRVHKRHSRDLMRDFRITGSQLGAIRIIGRYHALSIGDLSRRMYLHISTVSSIVDSLEAGGYLERGRGRADRRVVFVRLTEKGKQVAKQAPVYAFGFLMRDIESLSPREITKIHDALQVLVKVMRIEGAEAKSKRRRPTRKPKQGAGR